MSNRSSDWQTKYDYVDHFQSGIARFKIIDPYRDLPPTEATTGLMKYGSFVFYKSPTLIESNGKWGFVDTRGIEVVSLKYDQVCDFHEGFARVYLSGSEGYVDLTGNE